MGTGIGKNKRIAEATVKLYETGAISFNDSEASIDETSTMDYTFFGGYWGELPTFEITQSKNCPITVLAVEMNVNYERTSE